MAFYRGPQAKWDRRHLVTVSTHLTRKQYAQLRRCLAYDQIRVYRLVRKFLLDYIAVTTQAMQAHGDDAPSTATWAEKF